MGTVGTAVGDEMVVGDGIVGDIAGVGVVAVAVVDVAPAALLAGVAGAFVSGRCEAVLVCIRSLSHVRCGSPRITLWPQSPL